MNKFEFLKLIANAPKTLKGYSELLNYARNVYKQIMGVFPEGIDNITIKQAAKEASENREKIIEFPKEKITDPFKPRPGEFGITVLDDAGKPVKFSGRETPEGIMDFLMKSGKSADTNIGKAPKTTKKKPDVDPELQKAEDRKQLFMDFENRTETEAEMLARMKKQNKEAVERLKKKKEKDLGDKLKDLPDDIDPDAMADGGRIGFDKGGEAGFAGDPMEGDKYAMAQPQEPEPMGPVFETNDPGAAAKEVIARMAGSGLTSIPMGRGFGLDFGLGARRSIDAGISFNPQNPNFNFQAGAGILKGKPVLGLQFSKPFKKGGPVNPGRRSFLKLMGGLAALPFVGKFFKPAAKVAETAGPVVAEGVKLGFDKFMMLVDKIKRLGRKTDRVTQTEREEGFVYTGKDGSQYELVEDLSTGDLRITKDKPGGMTVGDESFDTIEDRSTFYLKRNQADETTKGKKPPDEYDEVKEVPGPDGTFDDLDEVDNETVTEILEELGETRTKKASGGLAYMLGE